MTEPFGLALVPRTAGLGRKHDLPPSWDGHRVEWRGWTSHATTAALHAPPERCTACGSKAEDAINHGLLHPLPGEEIESVRTRRLPSGRSYERTVNVPARPLIYLAAFRCPDCFHDVVWDKRDGTWWDLDLSDYGDAGSDAP